MGALLSEPTILPFTAPETEKEMGRKADAGGDVHIFHQHLVLYLPRRHHCHPLS